MLRYLFYRLGLLLPVLFGISIVVFLLIHLIPSDVVDMLLGMNKTPEAAAALRRLFGLDQPLIVQYAAWIGGVLRGDLGYSLRTGQPIGYLVASRFVVSAELAALGLLAAVVVGIPLGLLAALKQNTATDYVATSTALIGLSIPDFWLGTLLILLLSVKARWLPPSGYIPFGEDPVKNLLLMIMPVVTLAGGSASYFMRITRSIVLEVLSEDYVRT